MSIIFRHLIFLVGTVFYLLGNLANPASPDVSAFRQYLQQGDYERALNEIRKDLDPARQPDMAYGYLYCLYELGKYDRLIRALQSKRFENVAGESRTQILAGLALFQQGNIPAAAVVWAANAASNPKEDKTWECLRAAVLSAPRRQRTRTAKP